MHFHQPVELAGHDFGFALELLADGAGDDEVYGDMLGGFEVVRGDVGVDAEGGEGRVVGAEVLQVAEVAEVVEGFVGVFDGEFEDVGGFG